MSFKNIDKTKDCNLQIYELLKEDTTLLKEMNKVLTSRGYWTDIVKKWNELDVKHHGIQQDIDILFEKIGFIEEDI